jgi:hypothetical protein
MTNTDKRLSSILVEKDVENIYRQYLTKKFGDIIFNSPFKCDGYGESKKHNIRLICEFKDILDLTLRINQIKSLCQALYYIKKFEISGKILPSVIFIGDRSKCFAIHTNEIFNYLGMDFDWSIAPSKSYTNIELVNLMMVDEKINPHIFGIKDIANCVDKIKDLNDGVKRLIPITPHNVTEVFKHFEDNVIGTHKLDTNQLANLFVQLLVNPDENYLHPVVRRKTVVTKSFREVNLKNREVFVSFFSHFSREYTPSQKEHLTAVVDRLVQDITRRKQGEFFTPTIWVNKAHEYIESVYGEDWKEKYVVWDPAWGTGNLTRDYRFKELYVSTLNYSDIQTAEQMGFNPESIKFQSDFLNDDYSYLPKKLKDSIEGGKPIFILLNPPYVASANFGESDKKGASQTVTSINMVKDGFGKSSQNLYAQFLYQIYKLKEKNNNINIGIFSPSLFFTGSSFKMFRKKFFNEFKYEKGFLFDASNFDDVSKDWGINFVLFSSGINDSNIFNLDTIKKNKNDFSSEFNGDEYSLEVIGDKTLYNCDSNVAASEWVRSEIKNIKTDSSLPQFQNATKLRTQGKLSGGYIEDSLGYFYNNSNNIDKNSQNVAMWSAGFYAGHGVSVINENFYKCVSLFAARKLISKNWENSKDEYLSPNENSDNYFQFKIDSIVHSLFHIHSYQSSLRQVAHNDQLWDIKNEFFWMSKNEMTGFANQNNYTELYNDVRTDSDRYVHTLLFGEDGVYEQLSNEAKEVLDAATNLVRLSFGMRRNFADNTNYLNSWDAGYAQLKLLWKEYFPEQFKDFRVKYKLLEDKMRPMVYELGFLLP